MTVSPILLPDQSEEITEKERWKTVLHRSIPAADVCLPFPSDDYLSTLFVLECLEHDGGKREQGGCPSFNVVGPALSPSGFKQHPAEVPLN